jgi:hypothetical protein
VLLLISFFVYAESKSIHCGLYRTAALNPPCCRSALHSRRSPLLQITGERLLQFIVLFIFCAPTLHNHKSVPARCAPCAGVAETFE